MGNAKRRKATLGEQYGDPSQEPILKGLPITKKQAAAFYRWTTIGAWGGIGVLAVLWIMVRFIGPVLHWWDVQ